MADKKEADQKEVDGEIVPKATEAETEYADAWDEADKEEAKPEDKDKEGLPDEDKDAEAPPEKAPVVPEKPAEASEEPGTDESIRKALKDTKAHATKLAQENSEFRKKLKEFEEGKASTQDVAEARKAVTDAKGKFEVVKSKMSALYEEYPDLKEAFEPLIEANEYLNNEVITLKADKKKDADKEARIAAKDIFDRTIKPEVLKVHKDFDAIIANEDYWKWAEQQRPAIRFAAMESPDPEDINMAVGEFKKYLNTDETKAIKDKEKADKQKQLTNAQSLRGGKIPFPAGSRSKDPNNYDAGFDEAEAQLKKEGLG